MDNRSTQALQSHVGTLSVLFLSPQETARSQLDQKCGTFSYPTNPSFDQNQKHAVSDNH